MSAPDLVDLIGQLFGDGSSDFAMIANRTASDKDAARTWRSPIQRSHIVEHLNGTLRAGVIPRTDQDGNFVKWAMIDLDVNRDVAIPPELAIRAICELHDDLQQAGLIPWIERSKSRGWHLWVFFKGPVPTPKLRGFLLHHIKIVSERVLPPGADWHIAADAVTPRGDSSTYGNGVWLPCAGFSSPPHTRFHHRPSMQPYEDLQHPELFEYINAHRNEPSIITNSPIEAAVIAKRFTGPKAGAHEFNQITRVLHKLGIYDQLEISVATTEKIRIRCPFHDSRGEGRSRDPAVIFSSGRFFCWSCGKKCSLEQFVEDFNGQ